MIRPPRNTSGACNLTPHYSYVQINPGKVYMQLGRPVRAVPLLKAGMSKGDPDADTYYWYAEALLATGQAADAEQAARQAVRMEPQDKDAQELLRKIVEQEKGPNVSAKSQK